MSSPPKPHPDGTTLPSRHRPQLGGLSKAQTEKDLWLFDEPLDQEKPIKLAPRSYESSGGVSSDLASPVADDALVVDSSSENLDQDLPPAKEEDEGRAIRKKVSERVAKPVLQGTRPLKVKPPSDFDDLEQWDEPDAAPATRVTGAKVTVAKVTAKISPVLPEVVEETLVDTVNLTAKDGEAAPVVAPTQAAALVPSLLQRLSKLERIFIGSLGLVLLVAGVLIYGFTVDRLQGSATEVTLSDLPIEGAPFTLVEADSFWRAPLREGAKAETARMGTQLLPVVTFTVKGGPGAVRLFFRDADGALLGDVITRQISSPGRYEVAATVGFEDIGMHSAYRTGQTKPWTVDFYEAKSETAPASSFKRLIRFAISTARR